jgi:metallophosphoesterase (TIGR03767 family)
MKAVRGAVVAIAALALGGVGEAGAKAPPTTVRATVAGDPAAPYSALTGGPGWPRVIRADLAAPRPGRRERRRSLLYFAQVTDFQLADEESPARVEFLDPLGSPFAAAWRPQEAFVPQMVDASIRRINRLRRSPLRGRGGRRARLRLALATGDLADNQQLNETRWVRTLLEGGRLDPNSGVQAKSCSAGPLPAGEARRYTGVQDRDDLADERFYDPDSPSGPFSAWPRYPGILDRAQRPFDAAGLEVPSYVALGNHDVLVQGNAAATAGYVRISRGCVKALGIPSATAARMARAAAGPAAQGPGEFPVPPDPRRRLIDERRFKAELGEGGQADAHGFGFLGDRERRASHGAAGYYSFSPRPGIRLIALETNPDAGVVGLDGNIDDPQFRWLERELDRAGRRGELVMVYAHHPISSLTAAVPDESAPPCESPEGRNPGCDLDPRSSQPIHLAADFTALLLAHPNVVAYVAGHHHTNRVTAHPRAGGQGGFYEIVTASEVDWPVQSRLLELMDNRDGTLSIFGTMVDQGGPIGAPPPGTLGRSFGRAELAALGRTFSFNDPQSENNGSAGTPLDRNVELVVPDPR